MSYPILFNRIEDDYDTQGYGFLSDAISCEMTEELNGEYEVVMKYPTTGVHFSDIQNRRILSVKTPYESMSGKTKQLFRIYYISEPLKGAVEIRAAHISYDLSGYPVEPFEVDDLNSALDGLTYNSLVECPFTLTNAKDNIAKRFTVEEPSTIRSCMMGEEGSILDRYRGEWVFDNFTCTLVNKRGENRGVVLRYGKNLLSLDQEMQSDDQYSHILAFAHYTLNSGEERVKRGHVITVDDTIRPKQVFLLDMSEAYRETIPTRDELDNYANEYATNNAINELDTNYTIQWVQLPDTKETITLGDTIKMYYHGVMYTSRVVSYVWDVLKDRYKSIEVGRTKRKFYDVVKKAAQKNKRSQIVAYGDSKNLIRNGVRPSKTKPPNIMGYTPVGTTTYLGTSYFIYGDAQNVDVETVDKGFKVTAANGARIDEGFGYYGPATFVYDFTNENFTSYFLPYDSYVFSATVETDNWKNYTVISGNSEDDVTFTLSPFVRVLFVKNNNARRTMTKTGEPITWNYSERAEVKSGRLYVPFVFDPNDQSAYSTETDTWDSSTDPIINVNFKIGFYLHSTKARRTGTADVYFKCTEMMLQKGTKLTNWMPSDYDRYTRISNSTINALF